MHPVLNRKHALNALFQMSANPLLALFTFALTAIAPATLFAEQVPLKILPLGDSITQAEVNRASYRYPLWKMLVDAGYDVDFVGSMQKQQDKYSKGTPPQPDYKKREFDRDHEGHFGWMSGQIVSGRNPKNGTGSGSLSEWVLDYDFDIALVHLGTNDVFYRQTSTQIEMQLKSIVDILRTDNPKVVVLLAQAIPASRSKEISEAIVAMNQMIAGLAEKLNSERSPVIAVDQHSGFDSSTDSYDGVHPNASGEQKIARRWFEAIEAAIPLISQ